MKNDLCKLCQKEKCTEKHHPIPKSVIERINPNSSLKKWLVGLCNNCHKSVHDHYIDHIMTTKGKFLLNKFDSLQYNLLKTFLDKQHHKVWKEYVELRKGFVEEMINLKEE